MGISGSSLNKALKNPNNLSDVADVATARGNLLAASAVEQSDMMIPFGPGGVSIGGNQFTASSVDAIGTLRNRRTASTQTNSIAYQIPMPVRSTAGKGTSVTSVVLKYTVTTDVFDEITVALSTFVMAAHGAAQAAGTSITFTYDTAHDTTGERVATGEHTMTLTITSPAYFNAGQHLVVYITINSATHGTAVFDFWLGEIRCKTTLS